MNLHGIVSPYVGAINPPMMVQIQMSAGYSTAADGSRAPSYAPAVIASAQVQPLTTRDLRQVEGLNLQGTLKAIYVNGPLTGAVRPAIQGGDLITLPDGSTWLISTVSEGWNVTSGWTKAIMTLQNDAAITPPAA